MQFHNGKVIVAHPGRQHSYRLASALKHAGLLNEYVTTLYYRSPVSLLGLMAAVAPGDNGDRIRNRCNPDLDPQDVKQFYELRGIAETLMWRAKDPSRYLPYMQKTSRLFGTAVAKEAIAHGVSAVVCYDGQSSACFRYLKANAPHIKRVLDVSSASRPYIRCVYETIMARSGDDFLKQENPRIWDTSSDEAARDEIALSDYFLAASDYVAASLQFAGVKPGQILKLPYGCNFNNKPDVTRDLAADPVRLLFVGQCVARKGLNDIARAMDVLKGSNIRLTIAGAYDRDAPYMRSLLENPNVEVLGLVDRKQVAELCMKSDVFVFPSCTEGMSLACLEAMGSGLPIICTFNSGVNDLVVEGETGFFVTPGDWHDLLEKIKMLSSDRRLLADMGMNAYNRALDFSWKTYELNAARLFNEKILGD